MQTMEKIRPATSDKHGIIRVWDNHDQEYKDSSQFWIDGDMILRLHGDTSREPQTRWTGERYIGFQDSQKKDLYFGDILHTKGFDHGQINSIGPSLFMVKLLGTQLVLESLDLMIIPTEKITSKFTRIGTIHDHFRILEERAAALL